METPINQPQNEFKCEICEKTFESKCRLTYHIKTHQKTSNPESSEKCYKCSICDKEFNWRGYYMKHLRKHSKSDDKSNISNFQCDNCEKSYNYVAHLKRHVTNKHTSG